MAKIIFDHVPAKALKCEEIETKVYNMKMQRWIKAIGYPASLTPEQVEIIWEEKGAGKNNLARYFLGNIASFKSGVRNEIARYLPQQCNLDIGLLLGDYKTFFAGNVRMQELKAKGELTDLALAEFLATTHSILGVQVVVELKEGILYGARSQYVTQGKGMLLPIAGGFMPDHNPDGIKCESPNPFLSAQKQLYDKTGIEAKLDDLVYLGIARDTAGSENPSIIFGLDLSEKLGTKEFMEMQKAAPDRYETKDWFVVDLKSRELEDFIAGGNYWVQSLKTGNAYNTTCHTPTNHSAPCLPVGRAAAALYEKHKHEQAGYHGDHVFYDELTNLTINHQIHICRS